MYNNVSMSCDLYSIMVSYKFKLLEYEVSKDICENTA